ncbi:Transglutaminase-like superfamily protein [Asanoa hainanensis]|uniref:Transglutaminase-like superfamily protein n=1 Tax=Asanoa hainanensis TaxID=560556 RepID=A0A239LC92_9ACTN|nr:transglutaminase-like domain-containing protein [Asanoa hainanensis]SNT27925.1 Transglutaminase-like superfamily protein [Asanoa hainanensis]
MNYARQTAFSDPGAYAHLFDKLPTDPRELTAVVRNVLTHYRDPNVTLPKDRADDIDNRWIERVLATDQGRHDCPLTEPRAPEDRVGGCCRDFSLLTVSALRHQGIPARVRIGFADYFFVPGWHHDHVVADYWNGSRWVLADPQIGPGDWPFDPDDMPRPDGAGTPFATAAAVWTAYRKGEVDPDTYGVDPSMPIRGDWFIRDAVIGELAARQGDEVLLWDVWGDMSDKVDEAGAALADELAALLLAADAGDDAAAKELADRYAEDDRLNPRGHVRCLSPTGEETLVDLATRVSAPAPARAGH